MTKDWKVLKAEIDQENQRILDEAPEDVLRVFQYEIVRTGAGTGGTTMGVWFEGGTAGRYVGAYYVYNILKLAMDPAVTLEQIRELVQTLLPKTVATARLCGLEVLGRFSDETMQCLQSMADRGEALELLNSLYLYGSNMNAWIHHYMKWGISQAFPIPDKADCEAIGRIAGACYQR